MRSIQSSRAAGHALFLSFPLAACGGAGSGSGPATSPQGAALLRRSYNLNLYESFDGSPEYGRSTWGTVEIDGVGSFGASDLSNTFLGRLERNVDNPLERYVVGPDRWMLAGGGPNWFDGFVTPDGRLGFGVTEADVVGEWHYGPFAIEHDGVVSSTAGRGWIHEDGAMNGFSLTVRDGVAGRRNHDRGRYGVGDDGYVWMRGFIHPISPAYLSENRDLLIGYAAESSNVTTFMIAVPVRHNTAAFELLGTYRAVGISRAFTAGRYVAYQGTLKGGGRENSVLTYARNSGGIPLTLPGTEAMSISTSHIGSLVARVEGGASTFVGALAPDFDTGFMVQAETSAADPVLWLFAR